MKITILDGYTLNPGDLSWEGFEKLGDLTVYDRTPPGKTIELAAGSDAVITNKTVLSSEIITQLETLKYIGVLATGYNVVDLAAADHKNIPVTNIPAYGTRSVAQMIFALLLELCHHVQDHSNSVRAGNWSDSADFCYWKHPQVELAGKTMGIIGFGRIGSQVGEVAHALGMKVLAYDAFDFPAPPYEDFTRAATVDEIFRESDVVSLNCPLTDENHGMVNRDTLSLMKKSSFLINASRGPLIVEEDLAAALNSRRIAGAAVDVLSVEPPENTNPLLKADNCLITPHIAWATREARSRLMDIAVENLAAFIRGTAVNVVNTPW